MKVLSPVDSARRVATAVVMALPALLAACGGRTATESPLEQLARTQTAEASVAYFATLPINTPTAIPDMALTLQAVRVEDARCPATTQCAAAGGALLWLQASVPGAAPQVIQVTLTPGVSKDPAASAQYQGHRITVVEVLPYPGGAAATPTDRQTVTLLLERLRSDV